MNELSWQVGVFIIFVSLAVAFAVYLSEKKIERESHDKR